MVYIRKLSTELSHHDCRDIKASAEHARAVLGCPLNTHVTFAPWPGSKPRPEARSIEANRLKTYIRTFASRRGFTYVEIDVWQADATGRNPHLHLMVHCPTRHRDELRDKLEGIYPGGIIKVVRGTDIRRQHWSGKWGSTLDYITRHKSQQAYMADRSVPRATTRDTDGRHRGIKAPIEGKRWGASRNIDNAAIDAYRAAQPEKAQQVA